MQLTALTDAARGSYTWSPVSISFLQESRVEMDLV